MHMQRSEADFGDLFLSCFHTLLFEMGVSYGAWSSLICLDWLASKPHGSSCLCPAQNEEYKHMLPHLASYVGSRDPNKVLVLT